MTCQHIRRLGRMQQVCELRKVQRGILEARIKRYIRTAADQEGEQTMKRLKNKGICFWVIMFLIGVVAAFCGNLTLTLVISLLLILFAAMFPVFYKD